jgi:hypothetical protein
MTKNDFGGWAIQESCFNFIKQILPEGSTILELGSGIGTYHLSKHFKMYSIENYTDWLDKYESTYIYAPIKYYNQSWPAPDVPGEHGSLQSGWYDPDLVKKGLPTEYDLILVDGPNGSFGRGGFLKHIDLFNHNVPIVFDDINREPEYTLMVKVSEYLGKPYNHVDQFTGYIL